MVKQNILLGFTLLTSGILLSGCTFGPANQSQLQLKDTNVSLSDSTNQMQQGQNNNSGSSAAQKGGMKTLKDFADVSADINQATLKTSKGDVVIELYRKETPVATGNFITLAQEGFYDGIVFHRVIPDFMAQVGDPLTKDASKKAMWGTGGPGYTIEDEFVDSLTHSGPGIVSMANTGMPNTGGSQFFITYEATPWLDGKHAVFGKVVKGMDVVEQITVGDTITSVELGTKE